MADPLGGGAEEKQTWVYDSAYLDGGYWKSDAHPGLRWSSTAQDWVTAALPGDLAPPKASGGGGSTSPTNVYITQNPGELYQMVTSDGSDGFPAGTTYQENQVTGAKSNIKYPATAKADNGINPTTNLPWDVYPDDKSSTGYAYFPKSGGAAVPVFKDGRDATSTGATYGGGAGAGSKTVTMYGPQGQGLYVVDANYNIIKYLGPTTAAGAGGSSSGGGGSSSSGGSSAGGGLTSPANRTNTTIHEGGYNDFRTTTNISEIGPMEAAIRASEFAANNALSRNKAQQDSAALYAQLLSQVDPNAYQAFLETNGGGRLDNALLSGGNALSANAINPAAMALEAARGLNQPASAGGGLSGGTGTTGGGDPVSPGGGLPSAPATAPVANGNGGVGVPNSADDNTSWATGLTGDQQAAIINASLARTNVSDAYGKKIGAGVMVQGDYGGNPIDLRPYYRTVNGILSGRTPGTQTVNPYGAGYAAAVDPRMAAQATDDLGRQIPAAIPYGNDDIQRQIPQYAGGGLARGPSIIGDPQADGRPNPEMIVPEDPNARFRVIPLRDMPPQMAQRAMGGLPRHAYGTPEQQAYYAAHPEIDNPFAVAPTPAAVTQPAPQPVAAQPAPTQQAPMNGTSTETQSNPAQIGTYSTAPGTAGQPITQPVTQPVAQPATTVPASVVSGASGGSTQPSQAAFDEVMYTRLAAVNPWMADPTSYMNVDYGTRDPIARRNYEQWLTMKYGVPQESIDFAQARNRLGGASMASMSQGR